eukprot:scaffold54222_cov65-Cyclotella_meneghiniana.AAC.4
MGDDVSLFIVPRAQKKRLEAADEQVTIRNPDAPLEAGGGEVAESDDDTPLEAGGGEVTENDDDVPVEAGGGEVAENDDDVQLEDAAENEIETNRNDVQSMAVAKDEANMRKSSSFVSAEGNPIGVKSSELKTIKRKFQACCKKLDVIVYCLDALSKNLHALAEVVGTKYHILQEISEKYSHRNPGKMGHCRKEDLDRITSITKSAHKIHKEMMRGGKLPPTLTQGVRRNRQQFIEQIAGSTLENCVMKLKELVKSMKKEEVDAFRAAEELTALYKETDTTEYHLATTRSSRDFKFRQTDLQSSSIHINDFQI